MKAESPHGAGPASDPPPAPVQPNTGGAPSASPPVTDSPSATGAATIGGAGASSSGAPSGSALAGPVPGSTTTGFHAAVVPQRQHVELHPTGKRLAFLSLTALGIVYGDIGTSPLYALQQCFISKEHTLAVTPANVYGILSLIDRTRETR